MVEGFATDKDIILIVQRKHSIANLIGNKHQILFRLSLIYLYNINEQ